MSDNQDTNDQVDPPTPHKKKETCITVATIHPAALRSMSLKHDSLPDPQTHPQATKEIEDMDSTKNPTKTVVFMKPITIDQPDQSDQKETHLFKEPLTRDKPDQKELQLLQQTPTDSLRSVKVAARPFNAIEEEDQAYNETYNERMNLKNQMNLKNHMNMKNMEAFNRSPDTDSE